MKKIILATLLAIISIGISYADDRSCEVYNSGGNTATLTKLSITSNSSGEIVYNGLVQLSKLSKGITTVNVEVLDYSTRCVVGLLNVRIMNLHKTNGDDSRFQEKATGFAPNTTYLLKIGKGTCN